MRSNSSLNKERADVNRGSELLIGVLGVSTSFFLGGGGIYCVCVCVFFPFILDFNGRTSRGHTGRR